MFKESKLSEIEKYKSLVKEWSDVIKPSIELNRQYRIRTLKRFVLLLVAICILLCFCEIFPYWSDEFKVALIFLIILFAVALFFIKDRTGVHATLDILSLEKFEMKRKLDSLLEKYNFEDRYQIKMLKNALEEDIKSTSEFTNSGMLLLPIVSSMIFSLLFRSLNDSAISYFFLIFLASTWLVLLLFLTFRFSAVGIRALKDTDKVSLLKAIEICYFEDAIE